MQKIVLMFFMITLILQCKVMEEMPTPGPKLHGNIYISCESPPWLINVDSMYTHCNSSFSLDTLAYDLSIAACPLNIEIPVGLVDININYNNEGDGRMLIQTPNTDIQLKASIDGTPVQFLKINDLESFFIVKGDLNLKCYIKNFFIGGCFHEGIFWEEL